MGKIETVEQFGCAAGPYLELFNEFAQKHELVGRAVADHLCYKCATDESFWRLRSMFEVDLRQDEGFSHFSIISGRPIVYIKMRQPLASVLGPVEYLELSAQKPDGSQLEGFDHIEMCPRFGWRYFDDLVAALAKVENVHHSPRPHHPTYDIALPSGFEVRVEEYPLATKVALEVKSQRFDAKS